MSPLLQINPNLDRAALAERFDLDGRVQVPDVLTNESAEALRQLLQQQTPWLLTWCAGADGARNVGGEQLAAMTREESVAIERKIAEAVLRCDFCYIYSNYPLNEAYEQGWNPGSLHEQLTEDLLSEPFAQLLRDITGQSEIVGADGYATHYGPGHFLSRHTDEAADWRRIAAYVLNLTFVGWQPEYGGYLTFYDEQGDVDLAIRPKFNSLILFSVPQVHGVTRVAPFAPFGRAAISGWARDELRPAR
jgi:Rps23 Pro-64 3,4-dihydroxylase Tpa1-like proline 4-hydroxylase